MDYTPKGNISLGESLSRDVLRNAQQRSSRVGGSLDIRYGKRWRPPQDRTTKIMLLPAKYAGADGSFSAFYTSVEHWINKSKTTAICSKQYDKSGMVVETAGGKCLVCQEREKLLREANEAGRDYDGGINWRIIYTFNILHLAYYHSVPATDQDGKIMYFGKDDNKRQRINYIECAGRNCKMCRDGIDRKFGRRLYWSMGRQHLEALSGFTAEIEKDCASCGSSGSIFTQGYECYSCGNPIISLDTGYAPEDIDKFKITPYECPECKSNDYPAPTLGCTECNDPVRLNAFNCVLHVKRVGEKTQSTIQIPRWESAEIPEEFAGDTDQWDFDKVFTPDSFDRQAKALRIRNPYAVDTSGDHTEDYAEEPEFAE